MGAGALEERRQDEHGPRREQRTREVDPPARGFRPQAHDEEHERDRRGSRRVVGEKRGGSERAEERGGGRRAHGKPS
jgi:hypothetical protein